MRRILYFTIICVLCRTICLGQRNEKGSPLIQNYPPKSYTNVSVSPQNWSIIQDKRGIMYIGNTEGLLQFDGTTWQIIKTTNNSVIRSMDIDSLGRIYMGASGEFGYLAISEQGKQFYVSLIDKIPEKFRNFNDVWETKVTSRGVYFYTKANIFCYKDNKITIVEESAGIRVRRAGNEMFVQKKGTKGIFVIRENKLVRMPLTENMRSMLILDYIDEKVLIITTNGKFFSYDMSEIDKKSKQEIEEFVPDPSIIQEIHTDIFDILTKDNLYKGLKIDDDNYAFNTLRNGIIVIDAQGKLKQIINKKAGLYSNSIYCLFVDKRGVLWAGLDKGVSRIEINSPITQFRESDGLEGAPYSVLREGKKIYVGTSNGIVYSDEETGRTNQFMPLPNAQVNAWNMAKINNSILAFTNQGMMQILDTTTVLFPDIEGMYCYCLSKKFPNHIFFGLQNGFQVAEIKYPENPNEKIEIITTNKYKEIYQSIGKIIADDNGDLWLTAIFSGIINVKFQGQDLFRHQISEYDTAQGLPTLDYNMVHWIDNQLIVSTRKGIYKATTMGNLSKRLEFVPDNSFSPLFNDLRLPVNEIFIDSKNRTWVFSDKKGFGQILRENNKIKWNYEPFRKIPIAGSYRYYIEPEGIIWSLGAEVLYRYDEEIKQDYNLPFEVFISKVNVGNDSCIFEGTYYNPNSLQEGCYLQSSTKQPEALKPILEYKNNSIRFDFAAAFYDTEAKNLFQHKLEGFDKNWSHWDTKTSKEYTNLPEGKYTFKLKAKNVFECQSNTIFYEFKILPPWYRTFYAYVCYVIGIVFLVVMTIRINTQRLKSANEKLEKLIDNRTSEIRKRNREILSINEALSKQKEEIAKQAQLLEESNQELEKLSLVASETDNAILMMDAEGNFEWVNESYTRMFGYTLEELVNEISPNIINLNITDKTKDIVRRCIEEQKNVSYEFVTMSRNGQNMWVHCTLTPIVDENNVVTRIIAVDTDITKIKEAEQEILKKNEEVIKQRDLFRSQKIESDKAWQGMKKLSEVGLQITSLFDFESIQNLIFDYIKDLMDTGVFGIGLYNKERERIEYRKLIERNEVIPFFTNEMWQDDSLAVYCIKHEEDIFVNDLEAEYHKYIKQPNFETFELPSSMIVSPLIFEDKPIGIITVQSFEKNAYDANDLTVLKTLSAYVAFALDKARVLEETRKKNLMVVESDKSALKLRHAMLPQKSEIDKIFDSFILFRPRDLVGGDFYWFTRLSRDEMLEKVILAVVDCTGYGVPGLMMSSIANNLLDYIVRIRKVYQPRRILELLDNYFRKALKQESIDDRDHLQVCLCIVEQRLDGNIKVVYSGAKRPLLYYTRSLSQIQLLSGTRRRVGGIQSRRKIKFVDQEIYLNSGDLLYLSTNGLFTQISPKQKRFGTKRMIELLEKIGHLPLKDQKSSIETAFDMYRENEEQKDDLTMIGLRV